MRLKKPRRRYPINRVRHTRRQGYLKELDCWCFAQHKVPVVATFCFGRGTEYYGTGYPLGLRCLLLIGQRTMIPAVSISRHPGVRKLSTTPNQCPRQTSPVSEQWFCEGHSLKPQRCRGTKESWFSLSACLGGVVDDLEFTTPPERPRR